MKCLLFFFETKMENCGSDQYVVNFYLLGQRHAHKLETTKVGRSLLRAKHHIFLTHLSKKEKPIGAKVQM
jgi:hypothetical protein